MPFRKRKATSPTAPASKKARVEESQPVAELQEALPSRSKGKSVGTPKHVFTKIRNRTKNVADNGAEAEHGTAVPAPEPPRRRGRPAKDPAASATKIDTTARAAVRGRPPTKKVTEKIETGNGPPAERKRGRPRKTELSDTAQSKPKPKPKPVKTTATAKKDATSKTTKPVPKASNATSKGSVPPRKRGRPPKDGSTHKKLPQTDEHPEELSDADVVGDEATDNEQDENQYWLMKAEPNDRFENGVNVKFSIDDLAAAQAPEPWDGVRNYSARNNMRAMRKGDLAFFYHSNCAVPGIVGVMRIAQEHAPDTSAFDPKHPYYDPKSSPSNPKWDCVHVEFVKKFAAPVTLKMMQENKNSTAELADMQLLKMGRLSVSAVSPGEWRFVLGMANEDVALGEDGIGEAGGAGVSAGAGAGAGVETKTDGYESDTDGEVNDGPNEELNGDRAIAMTA